MKKWKESRIERKNNKQRLNILHANVYSYDDKGEGIYGNYWVVTLFLPW